MNDRDESESLDESDLLYEQDTERQALDDQGDWYAFRVKGHLAPCWSEWLDGLTIANLEGGEALLTGPVADQAALHGLLARLRDLNLPLLSVNRIEPGQLDSSGAGDVEKDVLPSLALALGAWSGSNKLFEVVYMLWWYAGPISGMESLDSMGTGSDLQLSRVLVYALLTLLFFALATIGRKRQITR
jgi:hypothetical protein